MALKLLNKSDVAKLYNEVKGDHKFWAPVYEKGSS